MVIKQPFLRTSFAKQGKPVSQIISETLPNTAILAIASICLALLIGVVFGVISALYKDTWIDKSIQIFSTLGMSVPSFFSAIVFAWLFGYVLHDLTNLEMTGSLYELDDYGEQLELQLKNLILPAKI